MQHKLADFREQAHSPNKNTRSSKDGSGSEKETSKAKNDDKKPKFPEATAKAVKAVEVDQHLAERGVLGANEAETRTVALAGLLHDIGHYPFSHAVEELEQGKIPGHHEALVGHFGIGFFVFLLALPGVILLFVAVALGMVNPVAGVALGVLAVLYLALASAASSALHGIYLGALYQFAAYKQVPDGFDRDVMEGAFKRKKG